MTKRKRPERFVMRVAKGALQPADNYTCGRLREKGYRTGDIVTVEIRKARCPGHNRKVHKFGRLVAENIEAFEGMQAHAVLKRLQWLANVACEEMVVDVPGVGAMVVRIPDSFAFDNMDQGEFEEAYRGLCEYVIKHYWPGLEVWQIEEMAELMEAA